MLVWCCVVHYWAGDYLWYIGLTKTTVGVVRYVFENINRMLQRI